MYAPRKRLVPPNFIIGYENSRLTSHVTIYAFVGHYARRVSYVTCYSDFEVLGYLVAASLQLWTPFEALPLCGNYLAESGLPSRRHDQCYHQSNLKNQLVSNHLSTCCFYHLVLHENH